MKEYKSPVYQVRAVPVEKVVANTMQSVYENFLYSYDQSMGIRSYGACVDLLAQKYGGEG